MDTPHRSTRVLILMALLLLAVFPSILYAGLTPDRLYYGVGQRVVIHVDAPDGFEGELTIKLHDPETLKEIHSAPAAKGRVDLTSLFPTIWSEKSTKLMLAQLYLDSEPSGAPLVLQAMVTPNIAFRVDQATMELSERDEAVVVFDDDRRSTRFAKGELESPEREEVVYSGLRVYVEQEVVMQTTAGEIVFRMRPDAAPNTAYNFMHLAQGGFYTNIIFHRVVAQLSDGRPFVIQVGDPSGTGSGGPGYMIDLEKTSLLHDFGVLSMARSADPNTNGSQVFVCLSREGTSFLDGRYTAFAQAVSGADVIRAIAATPVGAEDRPLDPPMITATTVRDAPSIADRTSAISVQAAAQELIEKLPVVPDR